VNPKERQILARITRARDHADAAAIWADRADELATEEVADEITSARALTSIALSLSAMATVLLATLDDESQP
jgi:hypothetical protein